jgi:hypothetical protein
MHVHRCIGSHNTTRQTMTTSVKLTYLRVYDSRDDVSEHGASPSPLSSLTHVYRCIGSRNETRETMTTSVKWVPNTGPPVPSPPLLFRSELCYCVDTSRKIIITLTTDVSRNTQDDDMLSPLVVLKHDQ